MNEEKWIEGQRKIHSQRELFELRVSAALSVVTSKWVSDELDAAASEFLIGFLKKDSANGE